MGDLIGPGLKFQCSKLSTCSASDLPDLPTTKITNGTFDVARIPSLPPSGSALLIDGSRAMEGTLQLGSHPIAGVSKHLFIDYDVALKAESSHSLSLLSHGEGTWCNLYAGGLTAYGGILSHAAVNVNGNEIVGVALPTGGSYAANKNYVDDHEWGAGDITSGTLNADRIPILPTARYGSALLVDGSRAMEGTLSIGSHPIDEASKYMFKAEHDVAIVSSGTTMIDVVSRDESTWGDVRVGALYPYSGILWTIDTIDAGTAVSGGDVLYLKSTNAWGLTDADAEATTKGMLSLAMTSVSQGTAPRVALFGKVASASWSWTIGAPLYVSCTPGSMTQTQPSGSGDQVRKIGWALGSQTIYFHPDSTIIELV